jgi:hypothetical protein
MNIIHFFNRKPYKIIYFHILVKFLIKYLCECFYFLAMLSLFPKIQNFCPIIYEI